MIGGDASTNSDALTGSYPDPDRPTRLADIFALSALL
jgi:hypothetical protein